MPTFRLPAWAFALRQAPRCYLRARSSTCPTEPFQWGRAEDQIFGSLVANLRASGLVEDSASGPMPHIEQDVADTGEAGAETSIPDQGAERGEPVSWRRPRHSRHGGDNEAGKLEKDIAIPTAAVEEMTLMLAPRRTRRGIWGRSWTRCGLSRCALLLPPSTSTPLGQVAARRPKRGGGCGYRPWRAPSPKPLRAALVGRVGGRGVETAAVSSLASHFPNARMLSAWLTKVGAFVSSRAATMIAGVCRVLGRAVSLSTNGEKTKVTALTERTRAPEHG